MTPTAPRRDLPRDPSFRTDDQRDVALLVAQLEDQSRRLSGVLEGLAGDDLEWQPGPGRNTAGMLLAHMAITEAFWSSVAAGVTVDVPSAERASRDILGLGLDDDGMPAPAGGGHPDSIRGWDLARYVDSLNRARRYLRTAAAAWTDDDLAGCVVYRDREFTREWILYHLLEHYAQHAGQIGLVLALRRQAASA